MPSPGTGPAHRTRRPALHSQAGRLSLWGSSLALWGFVPRSLRVVPRPGFGGVVERQPPLLSIPAGVRGGFPRGPRDPVDVRVGWVTWPPSSRGQHQVTAVPRLERGLHVPVCPDGLVSLCRSAQAGRDQRSGPPVGGEPGETGRSPTGWPRFGRGSTGVGAEALPLGRARDGVPGPAGVAGLPVWIGSGPRRQTARGPMPRGGRLKGGRLHSRERATPRCVGSGGEGEAGERIRREEARMGTEPESP